MKLKETITTVEEKIKKGRTAELDKLLSELKKADLDIKENEARDRVVEELKAKNDNIVEWMHVKEI